MTSNTGQPVKLARPYDFFMMGVVEDPTDKLAQFIIQNGFHRPEHIARMGEEDFLAMSFPIPKGFMEDIKLMIGHRVPVAFKYCIRYATPFLLQ